MPDIVCSTFESLPKENIPRLWSIMQCSALCGVHGANLVLAEKIELRCGAATRQKPPPTRLVVVVVTYS